MNNILKLYPQYTQSTDRRQLNQSVDSERRLEDDRRLSTRLSNSTLDQDINRIKNTFASFANNEDKFEKTLVNHKAAFAALSPIVPLRRISSVPDKMADKDYVAMTGTIAVAGILLPEDLRDTRDGAKQVIHKILPESIKKKIQQRFPNFFEKYINFVKKYDFIECQTPFSFLRGSFLEKPINKYMSNKYGYTLYQWDKPLLSTKFGQKIMDLLKVERDGKEFTGRKVNRVIEKEGKFIVKEVPVEALKLKGSKIGKLICRALNRTTRFGVITLSAICLPSIIKAFIKPNQEQDKLVNGSKQALKSTISVISILSGIGLTGALLAPLGPAGSVVGMAIGSAIGAYISNKINKNIKTES